MVLYARRKWGYVALTEAPRPHISTASASMAPVGIGWRGGLGGGTAFRLRTSGQRTIHARLLDTSETLDTRCEAPLTRAMAANERRIVALLGCETGTLMVPSLGPDVETPTEAAWCSRPADSAHIPSRAKRSGPIRIGEHDHVRTLSGDRGAEKPPVNPQSRGRSYAIVIRCREPRAKLGVPSALS